MNWLWKLVSGWLPIGINSDGQPKPFGEWLGKIVWVVGIVLAVMAVSRVIEWAFPTKSAVTNIGSGGTQIIQQADPRDVMGFGCNVMRAYARTGIKAK